MNHLQMKNLRSVSPVGKLKVLGEEYWLISNAQLEADWEDGNLYRFVVVPTKPTFYTQPKGEKTTYYYSHARHIVVPPIFIVEYTTPNPILTVDFDKVMQEMGG